MCRRGYNTWVFFKYVFNQHSLLLLISYWSSSVFSSGSEKWVTTLPRIPIPYLSQRHMAIHLTSYASPIDQICLLCLDLKITWKRQLIISASHRREICPDSKVHGANMGPTWVLSDGPRWTQCWPQEPCYQGVLWHNHCTVYVPQPQSTDVVLTFS